MPRLPLPDAPRWVIAHGMADTPEAWVRTLGDGFAIGHDRAGLVVASPTADVTPLHAEPHAVLVTTAAQARVLDAVPVELLTLDHPDDVPAFEGAVPLPLDAALPAPLADELRAAERVWCVYVDGEPVSFAFASWRSAGYFDVSVETLPSARQLGLATIAASALLRDEMQRGRRPVWAAPRDNPAAIALARRLELEPVDEIWLSAART